MPRVVYLMCVYLVVFIAVGMATAFLSSVVRALFRYYQKRYLQSMSRTLETMFVFLNPNRIFNLSFLTMGMMFMVTLIVTRFDLILSVLVGAVGFIGPRMILNYYIRKRKKTFEVQFIQGLEFLSSSMKAGLSLVQAIESLVEHSSPPLSQEFDLVMREYRIGIPLNEALQNLSNRLASEEVNLMVYSAIITRELGGDISEIFDHLAEIIRSRHRVIERIDTLTAQGRLQAMVCGAIPLFLYGLLFLWQPEFVQPLFKTAIGKISIFIVLCFQVMVFFLIRKVISIRI